MNEQLIEKTPRIETDIDVEVAAAMETFETDVHDLIETMQRHPEIVAELARTQKGKPFDGTDDASEGWTRPRDH